MNSKNGLAAQRLHAVLLAVIGSSKLSIIVLAILYLISFEIFKNASIDVFNFVLKASPINEVYILIGAIQFLIFTYLLIRAAKSKKTAFRAKVNTKFWKPGGEARSKYVLPEKARGMIIFLSPKGVDRNSKQPYTSIIQEIIAGTKKIDLEKNTYQESIPDSPWRIVLDSVKYHLPVLEQLIFIPSKGEKGTCNISGDFMAFMQEAVSPHSLKITLLNSFRDGVDYEDMDELVSAIEDAHQYMENEMKITANEVLIDITGGQKVTTIAGAIVALGEGRKFQYVSTNDYSIKTYDVEYESL